MGRKERGDGKTCLGVRFDDALPFHQRLRGDAILVGRRFTIYMTHEVSSFHISQLVSKNSFQTILLEFSLLMMPSPACMVEVEVLPLPCREALDRLG